MSSVVFHDEADQESIGDGDEEDAMGREAQDLVQWAENLDFEQYTEDWLTLATSAKSDRKFLLCGLPFLIFISSFAGGLLLFIVYTLSFLKIPFGLVFRFLFLISFVFVFVLLLFAG